jgi:hypothetical protein
VAVVRENGVRVYGQIFFNTAQYCVMLGDSEAVLPSVVEKGIPVNPLLMYDIVEFGDELLSPRCGW